MLHNCIVTTFTRIDCSWQCSGTNQFQVFKGTIILLLCHVYDLTRPVISTLSETSANMYMCVQDSFDAIVGEALYNRDHSTSPVSLHKESGQLPHAAADTVLVKASTRVLLVFPGHKPATVQHSATAHTYVMHTDCVHFHSTLITPYIYRTQQSHHTCHSKNMISAPYISTWAVGDYRLLFLQHLYTNTAQHGLRHGVYSALKASCSDLHGRWTTGNFPPISNTSPLTGHSELFSPQQWLQQLVCNQHSNLAFIIMLDGDTKILKCWQS